MIQKNSCKYGSGLQPYPNSNDVDFMPRKNHKRKFTRVGSRLHKLYWLQPQHHICAKMVLTHVPPVLCYPASWSEESQMDSAKGD